MPPVGVEPTLCYQNWILSPARLPIPPQRRALRISQRQLILNQSRAWVKSNFRNNACNEAM